MFYLDNSFNDHFLDHLDGDLLNDDLLDRHFYNLWPRSTHALVPVIVEISQLEV